MSITPPTNTVSQDWPALFAALPPAEPTDPITAACGHIHDALRGLQRIETHLRAYSDADTDEPNLATDVIAGLDLALAALGRSS